MEKTYTMNGFIEVNKANPDHSKGELMIIATDQIRYLLNCKIRLKSDESFSVFQTYSQIKSLISESLKEKAKQ